MTETIADVAPDGCYCGTCLKECTPEWRDSKDAWVPSCHKRGELIKHPSRPSEPMEIEDILWFADGSDIDAYNATISDLRATERSEV
jgi:hypothetical protein